MSDGNARSHEILTWQSAGGRWNILVGERVYLPSFRVPKPSAFPHIRKPWYSSSLWNSAEEAVAEFHRRHPELVGLPYESYDADSKRSLSLLASSSRELTDLPDAFFLDVEHGTIDFREPKIAALLTSRDQVHVISWLTMDEPHFDVQTWLKLPESLQTQLVSDVKPGGEHLYKLITETYLPLLEEDGGFWNNDSYTIRLEKELELDKSATAQGPEEDPDSLFTHCAYQVGKALGSEDEAVAFISHTAALFLWVALTPAMVALGLREADFQDLIRSLLIERVAAHSAKKGADLAAAFTAYDAHTMKIFTQSQLAAATTYLL